MSRGLKSGGVFVFLCCCSLCICWLIADVHIYIYIYMYIYAQFTWTSLSNSDFRFLILQCRVRASRGSEGLHSPPAMAYFVSRVFYSAEWLVYVYSAESKSCVYSRYAVQWKPLLLLASWMNIFNLQHMLNAAHVLQILLLNACCEMFVRFAYVEEAPFCRISYFVNAY